MSYISPSHTSINTRIVVALKATPYHRAHIKVVRNPLHIDPFPPRIFPQLRPDKRDIIAQEKCRVGEERLEALRTIDQKYNEIDQAEEKLEELDKMDRMPLDWQTGTRPDRPFKPIPIHPLLESQVAAYRRKNISLGWLSLHPRVAAQFEVHTPAECPMPLVPYIPKSVNRHRRVEPEEEEEDGDGPDKDWQRECEARERWVASLYRPPIIEEDPFEKKPKPYAHEGVYFYWHAFWWYVELWFLFPLYSFLIRPFTMTALYAIGWMLSVFVPWLFRKVHELLGKVDWELAGAFVVAALVTQYLPGMEGESGEVETNDANAPVYIIKIPGAWAIGHGSVFE